MQNYPENDQYDLIIVGAGMIGSALAICLRESGLNIAMIESHQFTISNESSFDDRNLVLSLSSQRILASQQLWNNLVAEASQIKKIHVSEQHRFASVVLSADQLGLDTLAFSLKARSLGQMFHQQLSNISKLEMFCPASVIAINQDSNSVFVDVKTDDKIRRLKSRLLILADGTLSAGRKMLGFETTEKDYQQQAIVCNVETEISQQSIAYERFSKHGPIALLPTVTEKQSGLVFTVENDQLGFYLNANDDEFLESITDRFGRRLGKFIRVGSRKNYPLRLISTKQQFIGRTLLMGNSAHTIHPNAAQGFNLGLRDVACLVELINPLSTTRQDIGAKAVLEKYSQSRKSDHERVIKFTDGLANVFYNDDVIKSRLRSLAMLVTEQTPMIKRSLMVRALGLYGTQAKMVKMKDRQWL